MFQIDKSKILEVPTYKLIEQLEKEEGLDERTKDLVLRMRMQHDSFYRLVDDYNNLMSKLIMYMAKYGVIEDEHTGAESKSCN